MLNASKGSVIIQCKTNEDLEKFKTDTKAKLGEKFKIQMPHLRSPKIKIYGIDQKYEDAKMSELLNKQNNLTGENVTMKIVRIELVRNTNFYSIQSLK
jgi:NAD-dependent DNA ligase